MTVGPPSSRRKAGYIRSAHGADIRMAHNADDSPSQVEYAMEAINHAGTVIGILAQCAPPSEDDSKKDAKAKEGTSTKDDVTMTDAPAASTSASTTEPTASSSSASAEKAPGGVAVDPKTGKKKRMGVVLAAEKKVTSKLLEKEQGASEKIFVVNGCISLVLAGTVRVAESIGAQEHDLGRRGNHCRRQLARQLHAQRGSGALRQVSSAMCAALMKRSESHRAT